MGAAGWLSSRRNVVGGEVSGPAWPAPVLSERHGRRSARRLPGQLEAEGPALPAAAPAADRGPGGDRPGRPSPETGRTHLRRPGPLPGEDRGRVPRGLTRPFLEDFI